MVYLGFDERIEFDGAVENRCLSVCDEAAMTMQVRLVGDSRGRSLHTFRGADTSLYPPPRLSSP